MKIDYPINSYRDLPWDVLFKGMGILFSNSVTDLCMVKGSLKFHRCEKIILTSTVTLTLTLKTMP